MKQFSRLLLLAALIGIGLNQSFGVGARIQNPFPLGTIGCLVSDVCTAGQRCKDDQLFGSCESIEEASSGEYEFRLSTKQLRQLEDQIWSLIKKQFTWKDAYTQCSLQNMLLAFAQGENFDNRWCQEALSDTNSYSENVQEEIATVLQKLMDFQDGRRLQAAADGLGGLGMDSLIPLSNKRDEFVNIHKYFDASRGQYKRDPYMDDESNYRNYLNPLLSDSSQTADMAYLQDVPQQVDEALIEAEAEAEAEEEAEAEVKAETDFKMRQYLLALEQMAETGQGMDETDPQSELGEYEEPILVEETASPNVIIEEKPQTGNEENYLPLNDGSETTLMDAEAMDNNAQTNEAADLLDNSDPSQVKSSGQSMEAEMEEVPTMEGSEVENVDESMSISPPDEKALENLLEGEEWKLQAQTLEQEQLKRLTKYVESMVETLETDQPLEEADVLEKGDTAVVENSPMEEVVDQDSQSESLDAQPTKEEFPMDKKAVDQSDEQVYDYIDRKRSDVVKTRYVNVEIAQPISESQAVAFVRNLTKAIGLNASVVNENTIAVKDGKIIFEVEPNPYINASAIADKANSDEVKTQLAKLSDINLKSAGIGKETQVALSKDNKYVVLTFILVGSIAGILLAVIVIYIVKRHSLSRKKLAQLSSNGEGNEASKDYQDLCRQRMQSKSSEKPEPLHAASRIGSVSESQVRSPSSRSSTSSWSEEPVASNMDISTGHIVLSYMEDHLKNQDRLDQEWEALCAYEADPSATVVASDPSNTRKNRYGDILPYDHSRVVISTAANVSGSDYINANFITDHDPRNPAFIATQGPLPHTVADFWQMVWEQGSVVIVMLTKLTENGTAMCHRYWPEEGSDLYHIYEVHLVSEHIWCDDYLVRSFYLKNLQTNETRTVTQFHFLTWPNLGVPGSIKALLDFRRKVNKSYRGRSCPIVVHCSDGCGRTGTYCLIDMVLNRMAKGAKEIDMAATLEHIRDQRMSMVKTKEQFQFSLAGVAEEVHAILKALPQ